MRMFRKYPEMRMFRRYPEMRMFRKYPEMRMFRMYTAIRRSRGHIAEMDVHEYNYFAECDMILSVEVTRSRDVFILQGFVRHPNQTFDGSVIHRF